MAFIGVGQHGATTKKALREAIATSPEKVTFFGTSPMGPQWTGKNATELADGDKLTVVGPDPYSRRDWYATVFWKNGKLTVS